MPKSVIDGPVSKLFQPLLLRGNADLAELGPSGLSPDTTAAAEHAPSGDCTGYGQIEDHLDYQRPREYFFTAGLRF